MVLYIIFRDFTHQLMKGVALCLLLLQLPGIGHSQTGPPFWKEVVVFKNQDSVSPPPMHAILFVGSSSFTKWTDVASYFPGYNIINRGFGGSTLTDLIRYTYEVILPYKPRQVVIYCGENDLASPDSIPVAEVINRFKTLFGMLRQNLPHVKIDFISIKPSPSRESIQRKVKLVNREIRLFLKQRNASFIDIYPAMLTPYGKIREDLFLEDRLHMKPEGYRIWSRIIRPYLVK